MRRLVLPLFLSLFTTTPVVAQTADIPEWFLNPPRRDGWITSVAMGQSKIDALGWAIIDIADQLLLQPTSDTAAVRVVINHRIGSIDVRAITERFTESAGEAPRQHQQHVFRRAARLVSADSSTKLEVYTASTRPDGGEEEIARTVSLQGELRIFVEALGGLGARITTVENSSGYFALVSVPESALRTGPR